MLPLVALLVTGRGSIRLILTAQTNPIVLENARSVVPEAWDVSGAGDPSLQGFASDISINTGQTVDFKVKTTASAYTLDIYRLGYYGGAGARRVASLVRSTPQTQPPCVVDGVTGLADCGNWAVSATWTAANAVSGIYLAKLTRPDTGGSSHIVFIVRDDARQADVVMQTSDTTWQAYNQYGGGSLYCAGPHSNAGTVYSCTGRATKVSYNRPFDTRAHDATSFLFNAEYPMVRFLEANGYDVKYISGVDTERRAADLTGASKPKAFLSVGHDEYWSAGQRASVEAARNAGVSLAFFSGNEMYWKTRFEPAIDGTPYRTLVGYKDTLGGVKLDPMPNVTTGTWRDARFGAPVADGGRPENGLTGQLWTVNSGTTAISVPASMARLRFWKNTRVEALTSGSVTLAPETLGYEWNEDVDNGFGPAGRIHLSATTVNGVEKILDFGETVGIGTATHNLTLYRHDSGALVFGAGTVQWTWGLDSTHDRGSNPPDQAMQQATVNLLADMGAQPGSLQIGADPSKPLIATAKSADVVPPAAAITSPAAGSTVVTGDRVVVAGTATDGGGGSVAGVEVSVDGGSTWRAAQGASAWTFEWAPGAPGHATIRVRAIDDSTNVEDPGTEIAVTVEAGDCPCSSLWRPATVPLVPDVDDASAVNLGLKFTSDTDGFVKGVRFYKGAGNLGTHVGNLWTMTGTLLATATFINESPSGWQEVLFDVAVPIAANATYVVSYHTNVGHYSATGGYFNTSGADAQPLHAPPTAVAGGNGVFLYGPAAFPTQTFNGTNYWVDVVFDSTPDTTAPQIGDVAATPIDSSVALVSWTTDEPATSAVDYSTDGAFPAAQTQTMSDGAYLTSHSVRLTALLTNTSYFYRVRSTDRAGNQASRPLLGPAPPPVPGGPPAPPPLTFTMPSPTLRDTRVSDFSAGSSSGVYLSEDVDGEVILAPESGAEFSGTALPIDWSVNIWSPGGSAIVGDGRLVVDGARVAREGALAGAGRSLEFVATFTGDPFQHSGYGQTLQSSFEPFALFSTSWTDAQGTFQSGGSLGVRTFNGTDPGGEMRTNLGSHLLNAPHRFRIDWLPAQVVYSVDGVQVASHPMTIANTMRPVAASDFNAFSGTIGVDWVRSTPYATTGSFLSRVFDASAPVRWQQINWVADIPADTTLTISVRTASTPNNWSDWVPVAAPGALGLESQYIQYQAQMTTADPHRTPVLADVQINSVALPPATPLPQRIEFGPLPGKTFGDPAFELHATATPSGLPVSFTIVSGPATIGAGNVVTITGAGIVVVRASQDGNGGSHGGPIYQAADPVDQAFSVAKATPAISWPAPAEIIYGTPLGASQLNAATTIAGTFVYTPAAGTILPAGAAKILSVTFTPADSANYTSATASVTITVAQATPAITWTVPAAIIDGTALSATQLNATANVAGTFVYTPGIGTLLSPGPAQPLGVTFTPTDTVNYATATASVPITVLAIVSVTDVSLTEGNVPNSTKQAWIIVKLAQKSSAWVSVSYTTVPGTATPDVDYFRVSDVVWFAPGAVTASAAIPIVNDTVGEPTESLFVDFSGVVNGVLAQARSTITIVNDDSSFKKFSSIADFSAGTLGGGAYLSETGNGELMLAPQGSEFSGTSLPADWTSTPLAPTATSGVANGMLTIDGSAFLGPAETGSGQTLEFGATFSKSPDQRIGFARSTVLGAPMAIFIIKGNNLYARTINGTKIVESLMAGIDWLGKPHRYQITWSAGSVQYYVDGTLMISHTHVAWGAVTMRPVIVDAVGGDGSLAVNWIRMTPYAGSGSYTSAVFDATDIVLWQKLTTTGTVPAGTTSTITYRTGATPVPDETWTPFTALGTAGALTGSSRYVQFHVQLTTASGAKSPVIQDVTVQYKQ